MQMNYFSSSKQHVIDKKTLNEIQAMEKNEHFVFKKKTTAATRAPLFCFFFQMCAVKRIDKNASRNPHITQLHVIVYVQVYN